MWDSLLQSFNHNRLESMNNNKEVYFKKVEYCKAEGYNAGK